MTPYKPSPIAQINTFNVLDHTITFPESFKEYNAVREAFNRREHEARQTMENYYKNQVRDVSDLASVFRKLDQINADSAAFAVSVLMHYGIDYVSAKELMRPSKHTFKETDEGGNVTTYSEDYGKLLTDRRKLVEGYVQHRMQELENAADDISTQRTIERSSRSKWVGGGYGIRGAISGAIKAGALNAGTSVLRGIGDSVTDAADAAKLRKLGRRIAKDPEISNACIDTAGLTVQLLTPLVLGYLTGTMQGALPSGQKPALTYRFSSDAAQKAATRLENYESMFDNHQIELPEFKRIAAECMLANFWDVDGWLRLYQTIQSDRDRRQIIDVLPYLGLQYELGPTFLDAENDWITFAKKKGAPKEELEQLKNEVAAHKELIDFQLTATPERLASVYIVQAYVRKNGFYVEVPNRGVGSLKQEEYTMETDESMPESLSIRLIHNNEPVSDNTKLTTPSYTYTGQFADGRIQGIGKVEYTDGESFEGTFDNGTWVKGCWRGQGTSYDGDFKFADGRYLRHGKGTSTYPAGLDFPIEDGTKLSRKDRKQRGKGECATVEGTFQDNQIEGPVKIRSSILQISGQCIGHILEGTTEIVTPEFKAQAEYEGGHWVYGNIQYTNGDVYRGDISNPDGIGRSWSREGRGICTFANGDVYEGDWAAGQRHGFGTQRSVEGETYTGAWVNGKRQGQGTLTDAAGVVIYDGEWKKDKRKGDGVFSRFFGKK